MHRLRPEDDALSYSNKSPCEPAETDVLDVTTAIDQHVS